MVDPNDASAGGVPVGGVVDGPTAQVVRLLVGQVVPEYKWINYIGKVKMENTGMGYRESDEVTDGDR